MKDKNSKKKSDTKKGVDSKKIVLDDAGHFELDDKRLDKVAGGLRSSGGICRIQTSPDGCGMNM